MIDVEVETQRAQFARTEFLKARLDLLLVCLSHSWGGLEQVAASDAIALVEMGMKVRFLCLRKSPIYDYLSQRADIDLIPLDYEARNHFDLRLRKDLSRLMNDGVNVIHPHQTSLLGSIVPWMWWRQHVGLVATRHIMNNHNKRDPYHAALYGRVDSLLVMSQSLKKNVLATHAVRERRVSVLSLGLDFSKFDESRTEPTQLRRSWGVGTSAESDETTLVIGLIGRIDPAKGQATLIQAAARLMKNSESLKKIATLKFVMVGEETLGSVGHYLDELREMVRQFHLEEYVVFAGYHEDIPSVMAAMDIVVMPSRQEAFGLVAIEAQAMGKPVIISSGGSSQEIVGVEESMGLTVRPDDAYDLEKKILYLMEHPKEREAMAAKARTHVRTHYDRRVRMANLLEIYEHVLKRRAIRG